MSSSTLYILILICKYVDMSIQPTISTLQYFLQYFLYGKHGTQSPYSFVWCLMPAGRNFGTLPSQVISSQVPKCGVILTLYLTYSSKIAVTFEPIIQFGCPSRLRIYNKFEIWSILWLKAPSLKMWAWRRHKVIFTKDLSVN